MDRPPPGLVDSPPPGPVDMPPPGPVDAPPRDPVDIPLPGPVESTPRGPVFWSRGQVLRDCALAPGVHTASLTTARPITIDRIVFPPSPSLTTTRKPGACCEHHSSFSRTAGSVSAAERAGSQSASRIVTPSVRTTTPIADGSDSVYTVGVTYAPSFLQWRNR